MYRFPPDNTETYELLNQAIVALTPARLHVVKQTNADWFSVQVPEDEFHLYYHAVPWKPHLGEGFSEPPTTPSPQIVKGGASYSAYRDTKITRVKTSEVIIPLHSCQITEKNRIPLNFWANARVRAWPEKVIPIARNCHEDSSRLAKSLLQIGETVFRRIAFDLTFPELWQSLENPEIEWLFVPLSQAFSDMGYELLDLNLLAITLDISRVDRTYDFQKYQEQLEMDSHSWAVLKWKQSRYKARLAGRQAERETQMAKAITSLTTGEEKYIAIPLHLASGLGVQVYTVEGFPFRIRAEMIIERERNWLTPQPVSSDAIARLLENVIEAGRQALFKATSRTKYRDLFAQFNAELKRLPTTNLVAAQILHMASTRLRATLVQYGFHLIRIDLTAFDGLGEDTAHGSIPLSQAQEAELLSFYAKPSFDDFIFFPGTREAWLLKLLAEQVEIMGHKNPEPWQAALAEQARVISEHTQQRSFSLTNEVLTLFGQAASQQVVWDSQEGALSVSWERPTDLQQERVVERDIDLFADLFAFCHIQLTDTDIYTVLTQVTQCYRDEIYLFRRFIGLIPHPPPTTYTRSTLYQDLLVMVFETMNAIIHFYGVNTE